VYIYIYIFLWFVWGLKEVNKTHCSNVWVLARASLARDAFIRHAVSGSSEGL